MIMCYMIIIIIKTNMKVRFRYIPHHITMRDYHLILTLKNTHNIDRTAESSISSFWLGNDEIIQVKTWHYLHGLNHSLTWGNHGWRSHFSFPCKSPKYNTFVHSITHIHNQQDDKIWLSPTLCNDRFLCFYRKILKVSNIMKKNCVGCTKCPFLF